LESGKGVLYELIGPGDYFIDIYVYDENGKYEGKILGDLTYNLFNFYDATGEKVASANIHGIYSENASCLIEVRLTSDAINHLDVDIYDLDRISPQMVKIYAAFISHRQMHW